ncbi:MAG: 4Fe-4S dicluster domain-containing protein [Mesorhizobium sp.]
MPKSLERQGLSLRGGFNFDKGEDAPIGASGQPAKAVLLVGNVGASFWAHFQRWYTAQAGRTKNPLDEWSREVIGAAGALVGARTVLPNDQPFLPFQQWAMRAEALRASPLGILMHPEYGLWHAYRGALLLDSALPEEGTLAAVHLCDECLEKPCLKACPVDAHHLTGFAYQRCLEHVRSAEGVNCRAAGCMDRNACPYGTMFRYPRAVQQFFTEAFAR